MKATDFIKSKTTSLKETEPGRTLQKDDSNRLHTLFRNVHAFVKKNRPLRDYIWLCQLDKAKGVDLGDSYLNDKTVMNFTKTIAESARRKTVKTVFCSYDGWINRHKWR